MKYSKHAQSRIKNRAISDEALDLAMKEGVTLSENPNRILLTKGIVHKLGGNGDYPDDLLRRVEKVVPFVVVVNGDQVITAFRVDRRINKQHA